MEEMEGIEAMEAMEGQRGFSPFINPNSLIFRE